METGIQTKQLLYFVEASRSGSLLKAAQRLAVTQPAITSAIHKLESTLGAKLLDRSRQGVALTAYGRVFIQHAVKVLSELNVGVARVQATRNAEFGHVNVGVLPISASPLLPLALASFKRTHPRVVITVVPSHNDNLLPALRLGELDFVIGYAGTSEQMADLDHRVLFNERLVLVVRKGHPLAGKKPPRRGDLLEHPWFIAHPYQEFRDPVNALFAGQKVPFPTNFVEGNYHIANEFLRESTGIAVLPHNLVARDLASGDLVELTVREGLGSCAVHISRRDRDDLASPARALIREIDVTAKLLQDRGAVLPVTSA
ncbi:LysR family transcriptional regulator [Steroidobacter flavus]|uniref:LysR family transcriptional regulator n=1 Tax=Steroidobacter flavus TaxID=1842136 RepID=A0ABV8SZ95_9GAMM